MAVGRRLTGALVERGWSIVSGLALGIDTQVHRAALGAGGHTIAVLGNGLDHIYPMANERLAEEIVAAGGALVSEKPPGIPVTPGSLVARDRIQTGLSAGVVVIQTDLQGGPMHGARFALSQGRPLFVPVPGGTHADHPKSRGLLALATMPARELAGLIGASGRYKRLLEELDFRPVATALRDSGDYPLLFEELERSARRLWTES
jgi:DNA processing protein